MTSEQFDPDSTGQGSGPSVVIQGGAGSGQDHGSRFTGFFRLHSFPGRPAVQKPIDKQRCSVVPSAGAGALRQAGVLPFVGVTGVPRRHYTAGGAARPGCDACRTRRPKYNGRGPPDRLCGSRKHRSGRHWLERWRGFFARQAEQIGRRDRDIAGLLGGGGGGGGRGDAVHRSGGRPRPMTRVRSTSGTLAGRQERWCRGSRALPAGSMAREAAGPQRCGFAARGHSARRWKRSAPDGLACSTGPSCSTIRSRFAEGGTSRQRRQESQTSSASVAWREPAGPAGRRRAVDEEGTGARTPRASRPAVDEDDHGRQVRRRGRSDPAPHVQLKKCAAGLISRRPATS